MKSKQRLLLVFSLFWTALTQPNPAFAAEAVSDLKPFGQNLLKKDGSPRTAAIFFFEGMTTQDFVGIYTVLNYVSGKDLQINFVATKKGKIRDDRGRLSFYAEKSIDEVTKADIFVVPGGTFMKLIRDKKVMAWVKKMYDQSEYTVSICTGSLILAASGAIKGQKASVPFPAKDLLPNFGVTYAATPPPSKDGKYYSAAGAAAGIEIGFMLLEELTGSKTLSEISEFAAEWNPQMRYGSGDPMKAPPHVHRNIMDWIKNDPLMVGPKPE